MNVAVQGVPLTTSAKMTGVRDAPQALRDAGLIDALADTGLGVTDLGDVDVEPIDDDELQDGILNRDRTIANLTAIRDELAIGDADVDLLLGGECTFAPAVVDRLAEIDEPPLIVWLDAHGDFNTPETSPSGFLGGMALALACGRVPELTEAAGIQAHAAEADVLHVGARALDNPEARNLAESPMPRWSIKRMADVGFQSAVVDVAQHLEGEKPIYVHVDVDVLDPEAFPAVDYPEAGGLAPDTVSAMLRAVPDDRLSAVSLTAYNPSKDPGEAGARLVEMLADGLES